MCRRAGGAACAVAVAMVMGACESRKPAASTHTPGEPVYAIKAELAGARVALAEQYLTQNSPGEALALLVAAVEANPADWEALRMARSILENTRWLFPETTIPHGPLEIGHLALDGGNSLWAAVSVNDGGDEKPGLHTVLRWNLETLELEALMFPMRCNRTDFVVFDPVHRYCVVSRSPEGGEGTVLLCDAVTLKPVRAIGPWPESLTPQAALTFSGDGLLMAHPAFVSDTDHSIIWHLRDCKTGEILRSSSPTPPDKARPLAAFLDRKRLRVLHADGGLLEIPVSPVEPESRGRIAVDGLVEHAVFTADGTAVDLAMAPLPGRLPQRADVRIDGSPDPGMALESPLERFPWSTRPNIWNGLFRADETPDIKVDLTRVSFPGLRLPALDAGAAVGALAMSNGRIAIGDRQGGLTIHRVMPFPVANATASPHPPRRLSPGEIRAFAMLTDALAGVRHEPLTRAMIRLDAPQKRKAAEGCDFDAIGRVFPGIDFSAIRAAIKSNQLKVVGPESLIPLWQRLASADTYGDSRPRLVELTSHLSHTEWHRQLAIAAQTMGSAKTPAPDSSPWLAPRTLAPVFAQGDPGAVLDAINRAGGKGPMAAKALELALASQHPEWIAACLSKAVDLPPFLQQLALSRIAWLEDRKADALGVWPDEFPDLEKVRLYQDWDGWEQADFRAAYQELHHCMSSLLADLEIPADATPEKRKEIVDRIEKPETLQAVGRARFARVCMKAAFALAKFKEEKEATFRLAAMARSLGEAAEPCLRAEAMALTALGDYQQAHQRWVRLITEHPLATQEPGDYAEAAYTAFENSDPRQAMIILTTGIHRFPGDANFALRAGWVALLTGNADRAYRFLLGGRQIGFPKEKLENATALLAIAAAQSGATEDAAAFYQDLIAIDPAWKEPATVDTLEWPEELKSVLRQLSEGGPTL